MHFIYYDNFPDGPKQVFECDADDIFKADALLTEATGIAPMDKKYPKDHPWATWISCKVSFAHVV